MGLRTDDGRNDHVTALSPIGSVPGLCLQRVVWHLDHRTKSSQLPVL